MQREQQKTMEPRRLPPMPQRTKTLLLGLLVIVLMLVSVIGYYVVTDTTYSTVASGKGSARVLATIAFFSIFASFSLVNILASWLRLVVGKPNSPEKQVLHLKAFKEEKGWLWVQFGVMCVCVLVSLVLYMVYF